MARFYTLTHAMIISGLDEETIIQAGKSDYFEMHPLTKIIDPESFTHWLERRSQIANEETREMFGTLMRYDIKLLAKIAMVHRELRDLRVELRQQEGDNRAVMVVVQKILQRSIL